LGNKSFYQQLKADPAILSSEEFEELVKNLMITNFECKNILDAKENEINKLKLKLFDLNEEINEKKK